MSETQVKSNTETTEVEKPKSPFADLLAKTGLPEAVTSPLRAKLDQAYNLTTENNLRVARIQAAKSADPNNTDFLDATWRQQVGSDPVITEAEAKYDAAVAEMEKQLNVLREAAKKHVKPPLSSDEQAAMRELVNKSLSTIQEARIGAKAFAEMADSLLGSHKPEDGIWSLMPDLFSLKNRKGRKAGSGNSDGPVYATRAGGIAIDGNWVSREIGGKQRTSFEFAAEELSKRFNADKVPANRVTAEQMENALYKSLGLEFRDKDGLPSEKVFEFTVDVHKQNENNDSTTSAPETVKIHWVKWAQGINPANPLESNTEKPETEKAEPTATIQKDENGSPAIKANPAKKTVAAPKK